jgi:hypothetical protein
VEEYIECGLGGGLGGGLGFGVESRRRVVQLGVVQLGVGRGWRRSCRSDDHSSVRVGSEESIILLLYLRFREWQLQTTKTVRHVALEE